MVFRSSRRFMSAWNDRIFGVRLAVMQRLNSGLARELF